MSYKMLPIPLWLSILGNVTHFSGSKIELIKTLEKVATSNVMQTYAVMACEFVYHLIYLEERLKSGDNSSKELQELLYRCYQFIRRTYFDYALKKENKEFDPLGILAKSLRCEELCKVFKSLCIEILAMVKLRLGALVPSEEFTNILNMFVPSLDQCRKLRLTLTKREFRGTT